MLVSVWVMQEAADAMPDEILGHPEAMNRWMFEQKDPVCCRLGDERMEQFWRQAREASERFEREQRL